MITGELKSKVDRLWEAFWMGDIANPLTVINRLINFLTNNGTIDKVRLFDTREIKVFIPK